MPLNKPCERCGNSMRNRTKFQKLCEDCKKKSPKGRRSKTGIDIFFIDGR